MKKATSVKYDKSAKGYIVTRSNGKQIFVPEEMVNAASPKKAVVAGGGRIGGQA